MAPVKFPCLSLFLLFGLNRAPRYLSKSLFAVQQDLAIGEIMQQESACSVPAMIRMDTS